MVLFVMLYNVTLLFQSVDEILCEQCFPAVLFFVLYEVVPTCEPVDEVLRCDRSNESYWDVLSCGTVVPYNVVLAFKSVGEILKYDHSSERYD